MNYVGRLGYHWTEIGAEYILELLKRERETFSVFFISPNSSDPLGDPLTEDTASQHVSDQLHCPFLNVNVIPMFSILFTF
jgi:hypothetical protein